ncbi:MAG TPA: hypothetical protein VHA33_13710 [Candidatus Angelobacter sp.]|jgi:hypothetical protein|nr:hypothetical protein [Candidatus Angelobacter sp.]
MPKYAIYDTNTGHIVHTHFETDSSGRTKYLNDHQVLAMLSPEVSRTTLGVVALDKKLLPGTHPHIDPKTRQLVLTPTKVDTKKKP